MPRADRLDFARHLRRNATPAERMLWRALASYRPRFTRQLPIGPYFADIACRRARVIIELDGGQHADSEYDAARTAALAADGWRVLRCWNPDIIANLEGVVASIIAAVDARLPAGEHCEAVVSRAGRVRKPRTRRQEEAEEPPPTPPARAGGE